MINRSPPSSPVELPVFAKWERSSQAENQSDYEEDSASYSTNTGREAELTGLPGATDPVSLPMEERVNRVRALLSQEPITPRRAYQIRNELNWNYTTSSLSVVRRVLEGNPQIFQGCWKEGPRKVMWTLHISSSRAEKRSMTTDQRVELIKGYLASHSKGGGTVNQIRDGLGWEPTEVTRDFVRKALLRRPNIFRRISQGYRDTWALKGPPKPRLSAKSKANHEEPQTTLTTCGNGSNITTTARTLLTAPHLDQRIEPGNERPLAVSIPLPGSSITGKRTRSTTAAEKGAPAVKRRAPSTCKRTPVNRPTLTLQQGNGQVAEKDNQFPPPMTSQLAHEQSLEDHTYRPPESWLPALSPLDPLDLRPIEDDSYGLSYRANTVLSEMQSFLFLDREVFVETLPELDQYVAECARNGDDRPLKQFLEYQAQYRVANTSWESELLQCPTA